jgi:hypothetical protein
LGEEPAGSRQASLLRGQDVDDLPELVDRPVQIDPPPGDLDIGFVDEPAVPGGVAAGAGGVDERGGEPLDPSIHAHMINVYAAFCQEFFDLAIGEPVAQAPAYRDCDHFRWEATVVSRSIRSVSWCS